MLCRAVIVIDGISVGKCSLNMNLSMIFTTSNISERDQEIATFI